MYLILFSSDIGFIESRILSTSSQNLSPVNEVYTWRCGLIKTVLRYWKDGHTMMATRVHIAGEIV